MTDPISASEALQLGRRQNILLTGPSGAGRSTAINALEDVGYEAIDNLPLSLLPRLLNGPTYDAPIALGIDARNREFSTRRVLDCIEQLASRAQGGFDVVYIDCRDDVLLRRYSETRRRHPLAPDEDPLHGILREKRVLLPIKDKADVLLDTSDLSPHALRADMTRLFGPSQDVTLAVSVTSFSYKRGLPRSADMVFDCRFLRNPHWVASLRSMTGLNPEIAEYVAKDARYDDFVERVVSLCLSLLPAYKEEGKSHLSVALGCTGGRHRSVSVAEALAESLASAGWHVSTRHRELDRVGYSDPPPQGPMDKAVRA